MASNVLPDDGQARPMTRTTWLLWMAVSAMTPLIGTLYTTLILRDPEHAQSSISLPVYVTFLLIPFLLLLPGIANWVVLRRLAKRLNPILWLGAYWLSAIAGFFALDLLRRHGLNSELAFIQARLMLTENPAMTISTSGTPWMILTAEAATAALLYNLLPATVLGFASRRSPLPLIVFVVLGTCAASAAYRLYPHVYAFRGESLFGIRRDSYVHDTWIQIFGFGIALSIFGLLQGAVSGFGLARMFGTAPKHEQSKSSSPALLMAAQVFTITAIVLLAGHLANYAAGLKGLRAGFPELKRIFTSAPASDRSTGKRILTFSHKIDLAEAIWSWALSPDGRIALIGTEELRGFHRIDVESGKSIGTPIADGERIRSFIWSPTGNLIVFNQRGDGSTGDNADGRIRLFRLPDFMEIKNIPASTIGCNPGDDLEFTPDGSALWVLCEQYSSKPDAPFAIKLQIPSLEALSRIPKPKLGKGLTPAGPADIRSQNGRTFVSFAEYQDGYQAIHVLNLDSAGGVNSTPNIATPQYGGPGFGFCGVFMSSNIEMVTFASCEFWSNYRKSNNHPASEVQYRTFEVRSGKLLASFGRKPDHADLYRWAIAFDPERQRIIGVGSTPTSNAGALSVWDQRTGETLQSVETRAYSSLRLSSNGRVLTLLSPNKQALYVYRVED
jgi:WD40 repeat protein